MLFILLVLGNITIFTQSENIATYDKAVISQEVNVSTHELDATDPFEEFDKQVEDERNKVRTRTSEEWKQLAEKTQQQEKDKQKDVYNQAQKSEPLNNFKLFSWKTILSCIVGIFILYIAVLFCRFNDSFKKKEEPE